MNITVQVIPGFQPSNSEIWTNAKFALLGQPTFTVVGSNVVAADLTAGAVTAAAAKPDAYFYAVSAGGASPYTLTLSPALAALTDGAEIWFRAHQDFGAAPQIAPNGLTAKPLTRRVAVGLASGDIKAGQLVGARYYNNAWQVFSQTAYGDAIQGGVDSGAANALAITLSPVPILADLTSRPILLKVNQNITGAATLNVNATGAKTLKKFGGLALEQGDLVVGSYIVVQYDGTDFYVLSGLSRSDNLVGVDAGATDSYAITVTNLTAATPYVGVRVWFKANTKNAGAASLAVNAWGAIAIKKLNSIDLQDGDILAGQWVHAVYDGTNWQFIGASPFLASAQAAFPATSTAATAAHGLPAAPRYMRWVAVCNTADNGYSAGDEIEFTSIFNTASNGQNFVTWADSSNVGCCYISTSVGTMPKGGGAGAALTTANWRIKCYYAP